MLFKHALNPLKYGVSFDYNSIYLKPVAVFWLAESESEVEISKLKMANFILRSKVRLFFYFCDYYTIANTNRRRSINFNWVQFS